MAVYDENTTIRDKMRHPGPYNIVSCLQAPEFCWDHCPPNHNNNNNGNTGNNNKGMQENKNTPKQEAIPNASQNKTNPTQRNTSPHYQCEQHDAVSVRLVSPVEIRSGILRQQKFHVVVFPGGSATRQAKNLRPKGLAEVRKFVALGGGYVSGKRN